MQLLRPSDSNARPKVGPAAGVHDHRVSKKQANEGAMNVTDCDVKPTLTRGHYTVDTLEVRGKIGRFATCNGTPKWSGLSQG